MVVPHVVVVVPPPRWITKKQVRKIKRLPRYKRLWKFVVYYKTIKREIKRRPGINECRCDERLKSQDEGSTRLTYTGLFGELEHLKIETRLTDERFANITFGLGF